MSQKPPPPPSMPTRSPLFRVMNSFMGLMLRSPFHGGMSKQLGLITVTGRKSGRKYTTPVGYLRINDNHVHVFTHAAQWWKNLRGGGPVTIRMEGKDYHGTGIAIEDREVITEALHNYIAKVPGAARPFGTRIIDGRPVREDVVAHAPLTIMVDIILDKKSL